MPIEGISRESLVKGFLLGLSNGAVCLAYCAPAIAPFLMGEGRGVFRNFGLLGQFLAGRLSGYMLFAVLAWFVHGSLLSRFSIPELPMGALYMFFAFLLVLYGFRERSAHCAGGRSGRIRRVLDGGWRGALPVIAGFATSLSFCPPLLLAFTGAVEATNLFYGMLFFFTFFLGTSIFLLPLPLCGIFRGYPALKTVGKLAAGLMGLYYFYYGFMLLIGGLKL